MFKALLALTIISSSILTTSISYAQESRLTVNIGVISLFYHKYNQWVEGTSCEKIDNFDSPYAHRVTVELMLVCKALHLSGVNPVINLINFDYIARAKKVMRKGELDMSAQSRWLSSINPEIFYISQPIVRKGEFKKGIFGLESNKALFKVDSLEKLREFTALSSQNWTVDWRTIKELGLPVENSNGQIQMMYQMINKKRADYVLGEFRSADSFSNEFDGVTLTAVPNITLVLNESRHFIVSKNSPNAKKIFEALEKGIDILRSQGTIERAYFESGFYNNKVKNWKVLSDG